MVPRTLDKTCLRPPTHRQDQRVAGQHPRKIDALINQRCETHDLRILTKALSCGKHAAKQQRRIDRRDLALPSSFAGFPVYEVVEPATLMWRAFGVKAQRG